jgi:poly [ADP-ribose] polymerase 6/8
MSYSEEEDDIISISYDDYDEEEDLIIEDEPDPVYEAIVFQFKSYISVYNAYIYQYPAHSPWVGSIKLSIPSSFLPLAQQSIYGFNSDKTLLDIRIELDNMRWDTTPKHISLQHPLYGNNYIGYPLTTKAVQDFFTPFYKPRNEYKSATYLLAADCGKANQDLLKTLMDQGFERQRANTALVLSHNDIETAINFLKTGETPPETTKVKVKFSESPLIYFVLEICEAFLDLSDHCCLCRAKLNEPTVRPCVCEKEICQVAFTDIGAGTSLLAEIRRDPAATDLLITCCGAASRTEYLTPAPPNIGQSQVYHIISKLPSVGDLLNCNNEKELLQLIEIDAFKLLRWIILSNRSQFISLPNELKMKEFPSNNQFLTLMASVEKERKFRALRAKYGSIFLWHGSSLDRWHSIIRNGLINATGTRLQQSGAALGAGIYFARDSNSSNNYSKVGNNIYKASSLGSSTCIIGLCEVAKVPELIDHGWAHTCTNEDACIVRFLFVNSNFKYDTIDNPPKNIPKLRDVLTYHADK